MPKMLRKKNEEVTGGLIQFLCQTDVLHLVPEGDPVFTQFAAQGAGIESEDFGGTAGAFNSASGRGKNLAQMSSDDTFQGIHPRY